MLIQSPYIPYTVVVIFTCLWEPNLVCYILTRVVGVGGWLEYDFIAISAQLNWAWTKLGNNENR